MASPPSTRLARRSPVPSPTSPTTVHSLSWSRASKALSTSLKCPGTKKNVHTGKILSTSQEVDVVVLEVDPSKRRISLGLKQTLENPWQAFAYSHPAGTEVEGEVKNKTEFGLFIGLEGDVDGNGSPVGPRLETVRASRSSKSSTRVTSSRLSFWMWTSRRNASRSVSSSSAVTRSAKLLLRRTAQERGCFVRSYRR